MRSAFIDTTSQLLDEREDMAVVLADISVSGFADIGATQRHPLRVINVGIREQLMVSVASGFAIEGFRPIAHSYAPFLVERAFEQIKLGFRHQGVGGILVSIGGSYDDGSGRTHEAPEDVRLINSLPDWTVFQPGHPAELSQLLRLAARMTTSVYMRLELTTNSHPTPNPAGLTMIKKGPKDYPLVLAVGPMLDRVLAATDALPVRVAYTAAPFSVGTEVAALTRDSLAVVEPTLAGTSVAYFSNALSSQPVRILGVGVRHPDNSGYGTLGQRHERHDLDARGIRAQLASWLG